MTSLTYEQIAADFRLWNDYMDTGAVMTRDEFDALSVAEKLQLQVDAFGPVANEVEEEPRWIRGGGGTGNSCA